MSIKEAVDNLAFTYDKSNDIPFKLKLERDILVGRAEVIKRENNKPGAYPRSLVTSLERLPLEAHKVPGLEFKVARTKQKLPKPISTKEQEVGLLFIGSNRSTPFTFCRLENYQFRSSKFKVTSTCYDYQDGYIYVLDDDCKEITVDGIFMDNKELELILDRDNKPIFKGFNIDEDLFRAIKQFVFEANPIVAIRKEVDLENEQNPTSLQQN